MINVQVTSGVGAWMATTRVKLPACPHVGDDIEVMEVVVHCDVVIISDNGKVYVRENRLFATEADAQALQRQWDGA